MSEGSTKASGTWITYGCSLDHIRLQPGSHTVAAWITCGYSLDYIRLQPLLFTERGGEYEGERHRAEHPQSTPTRGMQAATVCNRGCNRM